MCKEKETSASQAAITRKTNINIASASVFDADNQTNLAVSLFYLLGFRKRIAQEMFLNHSIENQKVLDETFDHVQTDIKRLLGLTEEE